MLRSHDWLPLAMITSLMLLPGQSVKQAFLPQALFLAPMYSSARPDAGFGCEVRPASTPAIPLPVHCTIEHLPLQFLVLHCWQVPVPQGWSDQGRCEYWSVWVALVCSLLESLSPGAATVPAEAPPAGGEETQHACEDHYQWLVSELACGVECRLSDLTPR